MSAAALAAVCPSCGSDRVRRTFSFATTSSANDATGDACGDGCPYEGSCGCGEYGS